MKPREFAQACTGVALAAGLSQTRANPRSTAAEPPPDLQRQTTESAGDPRPVVTRTGDTVHVKATTYRFEWTPAQDSSATPEAIAKYNGLARLVRQEIVATVVPLDAEYVAPQTGARASSWVRGENGQVVLAALREYSLDGRKGVCHFENLVSTTASVVVASKTAD
jgi:hypothetical protein